MASTTYRQPQLSLEDLMLNGGVQQGAPPEPPMASGRDVSGQMEQRLLELLTKPQDQGPTPEVEKLSTWDKVRMTLADSLGSAFQAYGAVLGGGSPPPLSNNYGRFVARQDQQKADLAEWQRKTAESQRDAKMRGLTYLKGEEEKKQERTDRLQAKAEDLAWRKTQDKQAQQQREAERQADSDAKIKAAEVEMAWKERMASADQRHDEAVVRIRGQQESGSKSASDQLKGLSEAKAGVNQIANNLPKLMQGYADQAGEHPPMKPDQIMTMFRRSVAELNLDKDALAAAQAYFDKEVASQFQSLAGGGASGSW